MKILVIFVSCDNAVERCFGHAIPVRGRSPEACLPNAPYRYHNSLVIDGVPQFGCKNRCVGLEGAFSTPARRWNRCGACSRGAHVDCSGWCFCDCEFNR